MCESNIYENITKLKGKYDYLFVMMHWGKEYYYYPTPEVNRLARKIIKWGANGVIGSHSHQIQPAIFYQNKPIIFSLGNFFFPDRIINMPRSTYYPEGDIDLNKLPSTIGYPMVEQPTYKIWKDKARRGQIVTLIIDKSAISIKRVFTKIDDKSHLEQSEQSSPLLFRLSHYFVKFPAYGALFFFMRGCRYIRKKIKGEL